jgi:hypothetical protein
MVKRETVARWVSLAVLGACTSGFGLTLGLHVVTEYYRGKEASMRRPQSAELEKIRVAMSRDDAPESVDPSDL